MGDRSHVRFGSLAGIRVAKRLSALAKLDRVLLLVVAGRALERAHVEAILIAGIDAGEDHRESADRASTLPNRGRVQIIIVVRMLHDARPTLTGGSANGLSATDA